MTRALARSNSTDHVVRYQVADWLVALVIIHFLIELFFRYITNIPGTYPFSQLVGWLVGHRYFLISTLYPCLWTVTECPKITEHDIFSDIPIQQCILQSVPGLLIFKVLQYFWNKLR